MCATEEPQANSAEGKSSSSPHSHEPQANSDLPPPPSTKPQANSDIPPPPSTKPRANSDITPPPSPKPQANSASKKPSYKGVSGNSGGWSSSMQAYEDISAACRWFKDANHRRPRDWRQDTLGRFSRLWDRIKTFRPITRWWEEDWTKVRKATSELLALYISFLSHTQQREREAMVIGDEAIHKSELFVDFEFHNSGFPNQCYHIA